MAQTLNRLKSQTIKGAKPNVSKKTGKLVPNRLADGGGLYCVASTKGKSFVFIYIRNGKRTEMGLGSAAEVSLATAREMAEAARQQLAACIDPLEARRAGKPKKGIPSFGEMAETLIQAKAPGWRNKRSPEMWRQSLSLVKDKKGKLKGHCQSLVSVPVDQVSVDHVLSVLRPIWRVSGGRGNTGIVTAGRIRERIWLVLAAAESAGHRPAGKNPAEWRGHLENLLPGIKHKKKHHDAMPYADVPAYMARLRELKGVRARALEFTILTAVSTGETIGAPWREINLAERVWTIPAARMKADRDHRVPISDRAMAILEDMAMLRPDRCDGSSPVFPGARDGKPLAPSMMLKLLHLTHPDLTVHGFRASLKTWSHDRTRHDREVIEMALAHRVVDESEAAYWRSDLLERRRALMDDWCAYVTGTAPEAAQAPATAAETAPAFRVLTAFPADLKPANAA